MGGFAALLGHAAGGFEQARQQDVQRQFADEQNRRGLAGELLHGLITDPNQSNELRQAATQAYVSNLMPTKTGVGKPLDMGKVFSPILDVAARLRARQAQPPTSLGAPPLPPQQTNIPGIQMGSAPTITAGGPVPLPPGVAGPPEQAPPQMTGGTFSLPERSASVQAPQMSPVPAPPQGLYAGPQQIAQNAGTLAAAQAGGTMRGQIAARKEALGGITGLPPEQQAAMELGMPGVLYRGQTKTVYVDPKTNQPALGTYNALTHQFINQRGEVVPDAVPFEASLLAQQRYHMEQVPQSDGSIVMMPVMDTTQKTIPPVPTQGQASVTPESKTAIGKGKVVGGKAPTPQIMIAPPTAPGEQPRAVAVKPGGKVPEGAVTPSGYSQATVPTSNTRTRSEFAQGLIPAIDRAMVDVTHAAPKLGALKGRWNEFIAGRLGGGLDDDPEISGLRTEIGLIQTGMMVPHVGARGGVQMINKFKSLIDSGKASAPQLNASLKEMRQFLVTYAKEGQLKGWGNEPIGQVGGPPTQGGGDFFSQFGGQAR